jgi:hypothetical protein
MGKNGMVLGRPADDMPGVDIDGNGNGSGTMRRRATGDFGTNIRPGDFPSCFGALYTMPR